MITTNNIGRLIDQAETQVQFAYSRYMKVKAMNKLANLRQIEKRMIANGLI